MSATESTMMELGTQAPDFSLRDVVTGGAVALRDFASRKALLVMFICRHCPYVKHIQGGLARLGRDCADKDIGIVAISANDADRYPDDAPASLAEMVREVGFRFPLCHDASQAVAAAFGAACTPDFFLFDQDRRLVYRGQFDDSRPGNAAPVTGADLRAALDAVLGGRPVSPRQKASIGCNIKWKPGYAPAYAA